MMNRMHDSFTVSAVSGGASHASIQDLGPKHPFTPALELIGDCKRTDRMFTTVHVVISDDSVGNRHPNRLVMHFSHSHILCSCNHSYCDYGLHPIFLGNPFHRPTDASSAGKKGLQMMARLLFSQSCHGHEHQPHSLPAGKSPGRRTTAARGED